MLKEKIYGESLSYLERNRSPLRYLCYLAIFTFCCVQFLFWLSLLGDFLVKVVHKCKYESTSDGRK